MLLSAASVLVVAQSSSEIPEGFMNNPVHITNVAVNNQEIFKQILLHVVLIQGISTFSQNNCQPLMPSEECILASNLSTIYDLRLKILRNKKGKLK